MSGGFSNHLINSFLSAQQPRGPFGQFGPSTPVPISTNGPLAYAPTMHGSYTQLSGHMSSFTDSSFLMDLSDEKIATMQAKLNKKLGPEYISQRPGPGGGPKLTYAEGWKIINLANEVFGFNGWSSSVVSLTTDFIDQNQETKRFTVGVTAVVRVALRDGVFHEDVGYGMLENAKSKGAALDKCKKEAVTDAVKRALRNFGNLLGNCLYDKSYTQEVIKIKVPPPKFDKDELHRRPEFDPNRSVNQSMKPPPLPNQAGPSAATSTSTVSSGFTSRSSVPTIKTEPNGATVSVMSSVPQHMRAPVGPAAMSTPMNNKGKGPDRNGHTTPAPGNSGLAMKTGLNTPIQTPANVPAAQVQKNRIYSRQPNPPPPPQPVQPAGQASTSFERHVSFTPQPQPVATEDPPKPNVDKNLVDDSTYDDEYFGLNSEDDAFYATVDLGEGDEGIGGPIDFEEGAGGTFDEDDDTSNTSFAAQPPLPEPVQAEKQASRQNQQQQQQKQQQRIVSHPPPQQQQQQRSSTTNTNATSRGPSSTPTMGGFHFPPGVNPQALRSNSTSTRSVSGASTTLTNAAPASIGIKRNADTMTAQHASNNNHPPGQRRPMQGMGLSGHPQGRGRYTNGSGMNGNSREPLGALELGEGSDVKRMRR